MAKQVIVFPRGQLNDRDRKALGRAGVVVVEADDPQKVVSVLPGAPMVGGDDLLRAALGALALENNTLQNAQTAFVTS